MLSDLSSSRILVVDDARINIDILTAALHGQYKVSVATSGAEALASIAASPPDLILLDIVMPEMSGYEVCSTLKADPATSSIPVIFITAMNDVRDKSKGLELGAVDYITKPFQTAEVKARVRTHLSLKHAMQALADQNHILDARVKDRTRELRQSNSQLQALISIQSQYISGARADVVFDQVLETFLAVSESRCGFIGEVFHDCEERPYLKIYTLKGAPWEPRAEEFHDLQNLYGHVLLTGTPVISNYAHSDPRSSGASKGFPPVRAFLGLPLFAGEDLNGVIGLANRPNGYDDELVEYLRPLLSSCARIIDAYRNDRRRRQAEHALRESEKRFRHIYENSPVMMHSISEDGRIISVNRKWLEETGYSRDEVIGKSLDFLMTPESRERALSTVVPQFWSDGYVRNAPYRYTRKDGSIIDVLANCDATIDPSGQRVSLSVVENVTERKKAEEALEENRGMLQTVFDGISEPLIMLDRDLNVKMLNAAAREYYRLTHGRDFSGKACFESLMGRSSPCKDCGIPNKDLKDFAGTFERKGVMDPKRAEKVTVYCVKGKAGEQEAAIIRISDVTEAKMMERQLIQSEKLASLGLLTSAMAHEINNPNNFITFNIPILKDYLRVLMPIVEQYARTHPGLDLFGMSFVEFHEDIFKLLDNMEHGSSRITKTISRLKEFVRKRDKVEYKWVKIERIAEQVVEICRPEVRKWVRSFEVDVADNLPPIYTDHEALEHVLVNLLINAAHACDSQDSSIRLSIKSGCCEPEHSVIEVSDNGCGMDEAIREKIFDPFFTTKPPGEGTGLGLYISQSMVAGLGGRIEVESEPGKGSTFRVVLNSVEPPRSVPFCG